MCVRGVAGRPGGFTFGGGRGGGCVVRVGGAALPAPPTPGSMAWLQPGLTFQVSLAGDQSLEATNTAQNSEACGLPQDPSSPSTPPARLLHALSQGPAPLTSPRPPVPSPPSGAVFGGRAPIRPSLTLPGWPHPSHGGKVFLAIIKVIKLPKAPVGCWF